MEAKVSDIYLHLSATTCNIFLDVADMIMKDGQVGGLFFLKKFDFAYYRSVHPQRNPARLRYFSRYCLTWCQ